MFIDLCMDKDGFIKIFNSFILKLQEYTIDKNKEQNIKGFIDKNKMIFQISTDTKLVSKIIEIHIFPEIIKFAKK